MNRASACVLCGHEGPADVRMVLVRWRDPVGSELYSTIPRCVDAKGCRARVEEVLGEPWPIDDGTPATPAKRTDEAPAAAPATPAADPDEEVPAWLRG